MDIGMDMDVLPAFITILVPLLVIMDPPGNLLFFLLFTKRNTPLERRKMADPQSRSQRYQDLRRSRGVVVDDGVSQTVGKGYGVDYVICAKPV